MYPLKAILVNAAESDVPDLRRELATVPADLQNVFPRVEQFLGREFDSAQDRHLVMVRLSSPDDLRLLERVNTQFPGWPLVALIEGDCDAEALYEINRAGACQLLPLPLTGDDLRTALGRILVQFGLQSLPSRLIPVCGVLEGCGDTT